MRYPFVPIPGIPSTPDVGIGISLTPQPAPVAPVASGAAPAPAGSTNVFWAHHPFDGDGDDVLATVRSLSGTESTPPYAAVELAGVFVPEISGIVCAIVRNAPDGAVITWDVPEPVASSGTSPTINDAGGGAWEVLFDGQLSYRISVQENKLVGHYCRNYFSGWDAWSLEPISITPSVDGVPLRTLTLTVSALYNGGA